MNDATPTPWDALSDAFQRREDARRAVGDAGGGFDLALAEHELAAAEDEFNRAADWYSRVAADVFRAAVGGVGGDSASGYVRPETWQLMAKFLGVALCFDMAKQAKHRALWAEKRAAEVLAEFDALRQRIRELENAVAELTPGVGMRRAV